MSLKKGGAPKTIAATLTIEGQGSVDKLNVVFHNRKQSEIDAQIEANKGEKLASLVPFIVESWDTDFELTEEGVAAFEDEHERVVAAIWEGFRRAREKKLVGN